MVNRTRPTPLLRGAGQQRASSAAKAHRSASRSDANVYAKTKTSNSAIESLLALDAHLSDTSRWGVAPGLRAASKARP